jgi:hypothetical protein
VGGGVVYAIWREIYEKRDGKSEKYARDRKKIKYKDKIEAKKEKRQKYR